MLGLHEPHLHCKQIKIVVSDLGQWLDYKGHVHLSPFFLNCTIIHRFFPFSPASLHPEVCQFYRCFPCSLNLMLAFSSVKLLFAFSVSELLRTERKDYSAQKVWLEGKYHGYISSPNGQWFVVIVYSGQQNALSYQSNWSPRVKILLNFINGREIIRGLTIITQTQIHLQSGHIFSFR